LGLQLGFLFLPGQGAEFNRVGIVRLVSEVFEFTGSGNAHAHIATIRAGLDGFNRRGKIHYVECTGQLLRQTGVHEIQYHLVALLAHIDHDGRFRKFDLNPALAIGSATKINVLQSQAASCGYVTVRCHRCCRRAGRRHRASSAAGTHADDQTVALGSDLVGNLLQQIDHDPRPVARINGGNAARHADRNGCDLLRQGTAGVGQVDSDSCRVIGSERYRFGHGLTGRQHNLNPVSGQGRKTDVLQLIRQCIGQEGP